MSHACGERVPHRSQPGVGDAQGCCPPAGALGRGEARGARSRLFQDLSASSAPSASRLPLL